MDLRLALSRLAQHAAQVEAAPPPCSREAVYLPEPDVFVTFGERVWIWKPNENTWRAVQIPFDKPPSKTGQNRAMVYDPKRKLILLVLGESGDNGVAKLYALRPGEAF